MILHQKNEEQAEKPTYVVFVVFCYWSLELSHIATLISPISWLEEYKDDLFSSSTKRKHKQKNGGKNGVFPLLLFFPPCKSVQSS